MLKFYCAVFFLISICAFQSVFADKVTTSIIAAVLRNKEKDVIFSPLLVTDGLWQLYFGAEGETTDEIGKVLQLNGKAKSQAIEEYSKWRLGLNPDRNVTLNWANKLFVARDVHILSQYQQQAQRIFQSTPQTVDFSKSEATSKLINDWVAKETRDKITDLIKETDSTTIAMLLSAVYFKASWKYQFHKLLTMKDFFYLREKDTANWRTVDVDMMSQKAVCRLNFIKKLDAMSLELPYENSNFSMVILLPQSLDNTENIVANLDQVEINDLAPQTAEKKVNVKMPKFKFDLELKLNEALKSLGLVQIFSKANLSAMTNYTKPIYINEIRQKAVIEVDEEGSTASAAQVMEVLFRKADRSPTIEVNHPFVFLIKDNDNVYFAGRVTMEKLSMKNQ